MDLTKFIVNFLKIGGVVGDETGAYNRLGDFQGFSEISGLWAVHEFSSDAFFFSYQ